MHERQVRQPHSMTVQGRVVGLEIKKKMRISISVGPIFFKREFEAVHLDIDISDTRTIYGRSTE